MVERPWLLVQHLGWGLPAEDLSGSAVDRYLDSAEVLEGPAPSNTTSGSKAAATSGWTSWPAHA
jgi:hypothetical protein